MFSSIFLFEVRRWLKSPVTYIYFSVLFVVAFLVAVLAGGTFDGVNVSFGGERIFVNAPVALDGILSIMAQYIGQIIITAVIGNAILADFRNNTYPLLFTTPVSRFSYLAGRFSGSFFIVMILLLAPALGYMSGCWMPFLNPDKVGPVMAVAYWSNYVETILPNAFFAGAIFFAVSIVARDVFAIWITLIVFFVAMGVSGAYFNSLDKQNIAALLDPFGSNAKRLLTHYWSVYEKNHKLIHLEGIFLWNRLIWIGASVLIWLGGYRYFSFSTAPKKLFNRKIKGDETATGFANISFQKISFPKATQVFGTGTSFKILGGLAANECRSLLRNVYFRIIVAFGMLLLFLVSGQINKIYDTTTYPVTSQVAQYFGAFFHLFIVVLTIIFSGELIWNARDNRMSNILDALPVPNWVYYASKIIALWFMQAILMLVIIFCGVIVQSFKGYFHFELWLYVRYLFGIVLVDYWLLAVVAVLAQALINNKYAAYFATIIFYLWNSIFAGLVLKQNLFIFSSDPGIPYSEMNGFGHALYPFLVFKTYWWALSAAFMVVTIVFWQRGSEGGFKERWQNANTKANRPYWAVATGFLVLFLAIGGFIYYNTNVLNTFRTTYQQEELAAKYERTYGKYKYLPQPKITSIKLNVDIYPNERKTAATGTCVLKNKTALPISAIHVNLLEGIEFHKLAFNVPTKLVLDDKDLFYRIYQLQQPLQPGDSIVFSFDVAQVPKGFTNGFTGIGTALYNGTFMNAAGFLPTIGYQAEGELSDNSARKKHHLPFKKPSLSINDPRGLSEDWLAPVADFIDFEITVGTSEGQTAIAPGYLLKDWAENGRHYYHYKMDSPILCFFSVLSAHYELKREKWHDVNLEIWYQKGHEYDLEDMFNSMKKSLNYYSANFSPYQHKQVRILEYPRYASFAQSFPNTIPFSEGIGFIAKVDTTKPGDIDYPFYITAHEVAHQWFGHQVIGGNVEGANMLCESMAQYGAIMVLEKQYGEQRINKFLSYEMDKYLIARSFEKEGEKPLAYVDNGQAYILYEKGGIVFHALSKLIGEDSLNHALSGFIHQYAFKGKPYPNTLDFLKYLRAATPDSLQYFIKDAFEQIVFYENGIKTAKISGDAKTGFVADMNVNASKTVADSAGKEKPLQCNDYVEVGAVNKDGAILALQTYKLKTGDNQIHLSMKEKPAKLVIDPRRLLIDKKKDNNEYKF